MEERMIKFPEINWEELEKEGLPKEETKRALGEMFEFKLKVSSLFRKGYYLSRDVITKDKEITEKLNEIWEKYPQLRGLFRVFALQEMKKIAPKPMEGDKSETYFYVAAMFLDIALATQALREWTNEKLETVHIGLRKHFLVAVYEPRERTTTFYLPNNWQSDVDKGIALILRETLFRARELYNKEKGRYTPYTPKEPKVKPAEEEKDTPEQPETEAALPLPEEKTVEAPKEEKRLSNREEKEWKPRDRKKMPEPKKDKAEEETLEGNTAVRTESDGLPIPAAKDAEEVVYSTGGVNNTLGEALKNLKLGETGETETKKE